MKIRRMYLVLASVLILVSAACAGSEEGDGVGDSTQATSADNDGNAGGSDPTTLPETPEATAPPDNGGGETPPVTEMGSFTVNGTEFAVTLLNRCIPFGGEDSGQIDLQPIAQGQGAELFLYGTADSVEVTVQGNTVDESWGSVAFIADEFGDQGEVRESSINGDRWTGSATLDDIFESADPVEVTWDVMIPDEVNDCGL